MTSLELTDDAFLGGALSILQPATGYRSGLDAVLLAAAAPVGEGGRARVLDAGAGVGVVGLSIARRVADANVTLVELDPVMASLARDNIDRNRLDGRVCVIVADLAQGGGLLHGDACPRGLGPASYDHLVANPPYDTIGTGTPSPRPVKVAAHQMPEGGLDRWLAFLATAAAANATLTLIHRADALAQVLSAVSGRFGRIRIRPVQPRVDAAASRIIVTAVKGSRAPLELRPALVLQRDDGTYLPEVEAILRHGAPLAI